MNLEDFKKLNLPDGPGVYFFKKKPKNASLSDTLYIGKATSLRERVRSYFNDDLIKTRGRLLVDMIAQAETITFQETDSVLEAFILESELIKQYLPYYNTKEKDNKSFNYVVITKEDFPRVLVVRGRNLEKGGQSAIEQIENLGFQYTDVFGPYPFGTELREAMKLIRRIFPFRDRCIPYVLSESSSKSATSTNFKPQLSADGAHITTHMQKGKPCFNRSIGLCPGVCTGEVSQEEYAAQIQNIRLFFKGKKQEIVDNLKTQMNEYAKEHKFEEAGEVKKTLSALAHIQDMAMIKKDAQFGHIGARGKTSALTSNKNENNGNTSAANFTIRAEAYDIAHMSGKDMVGVMVVMQDGEFDKSQYKKFNIREIKSSNDTGALKQVLERRFAHTEWPLPTHIVLDGNIAQLNVAESVLKSMKIQNITLVAVTKDEKHNAKSILRSTMFIGVKGEVSKLKSEVSTITESNSKSETMFDDGDIISINQECHRFAIATHRKRRALSRGL